MALTDQQIRDAGILYLPKQKYLLNPFKLPEEEEEQESGNITLTNVSQTGGGGGGGVGSFNLDPTFTRENPVSTPAMSDISSQNLSAYLTNPSLQAKYGNFAEYDEFMQSQMPQPSLIDQGIGMFKNLFKPTRIKGTLGDRLSKQATGTLAGIPTIGNIIGSFRNPLNPKSANYNKDLVGQLNFLEENTGTRVTGTSDDLKYTDGLALIGRDPKTGGLKYGSGSVLAGKNVISGFGTNDYETALNNYISKLANRKTLSKFQKAKLRQANIELENLKAKQREDLEKQRASTREEDRAAGAFSDVVQLDPGGGGTFKEQTAAKERQGVQVAGPGFGKGAYFAKGGLAGILGF